MLVVCLGGTFRIAGFGNDVAGGKRVAIDDGSVFDHRFDTAVVAHVRQRVGIEDQ